MMIFCKISLIIQVLYIVTMCRSTIFPRRFEGTNNFAFQGLEASLNAEALVPSKHRKALIQQQSATSHKSRIFNNPPCGDLRTNEGTSSLHKPGRRVCEWNYSFTCLTSVRDGGELLTSGPGRFIPQGRTPVPTMKRRLV